MLSSCNSNALIGLQYCDGLHCIALLQFGNQTAPRSPAGRSDAGNRHPQNATPSSGEQHLLLRSALLHANL